jgi:hypothetical protein
MLRYHRAMAWVKVPPENHPPFHDALPRDPRVQTMRMFGGVAAKVNGNIFAGLFGRSAIVLLPEPDKTEALALEGAGLFDPMGNGRVISDKVMLPEAFMDDAEELRSWIARAFKSALRLPPKAPAAKPASKAKAQASKGREPKAKPAPKAKVRKRRARPGRRPVRRRCRLDAE